MTFIMSDCSCFSLLSLHKWSTCRDCCGQRSGDWSQLLCFAAPWVWILPGHRCMAVFILRVRCPVYVEASRWANPHPWTPTRFLNPENWRPWTPLAWTAIQEEDEENGEVEAVKNSRYVWRGSLRPQITSRTSAGGIVPPRPWRLQTESVVPQRSFEGPECLEFTRWQVLAA
jgi:hypothetical protein